MRKLFGFCLLLQWNGMELSLSLLSSSGLRVSVGVAEAFEQQIQEKKVPAVLRQPVGIKLAYNNLTSVTGLFEVLAKYIEQPEENVLSLDVSMNKLTTVEPEFLLFKALRSLYLHGNNIQKLGEVRKLGSLDNLTKFTFHGNNWIVPAKTKPPPGMSKQEAEKLQQQQQIQLQLLLQQQRQQQQQQQQQMQQNHAAAASSVTPGAPGTQSHNTLPQLTGVYFRTERIESIPDYREKLVWMLRGCPLKSLDNTLVSNEDRRKALLWANVHPKQAQGPVVRDSTGDEQND